MSDPQNGQAKASPHQAQGVVNVAPGEGAPKQVTYEEMQNQLKTMGDQLMKAEGAEVDALGKKIAEMEAEIGRRASKTALTRKINELSKKLSESAADAEADAAKKGESADSARKGESAETARKGRKGEGDGAGEPNEDDQDGKKTPQQAETAGAKGKGLISTDEMEEASGPSAPWFKDFLKANAKMKEQGGSSFSGQERRRGEMT